MRAHMYAPWFNPTVYRNEAFISSYAGFRSSLSNGFPAAALDSFEWRLPVAVSDKAVVVPRSARSMAERRELFNEILVRDVESFRCMPRLPLAFNFDLWLFRNLEEVAVGKGFRAFGPGPQGGAA